jgi:hypothetical protein
MSKKPKHRVLKPGGYIVVSRHPLRNLHTSVTAQFLKTIVGLHATLIQIPEEPNWEVRQNLKSVLDFEVAAKMADYAFLAPANAYESAPDCWEISKDVELAILIRISRHIAARYTQLLVQERRSGNLTNDYLNWANDDDQFVIQSKPGPRRPDLIRVGLAHPVQFLFEIRFVNDVVLPQCAKIVFKFGSDLNTTDRLTWASHELPVALMAASCGSCVLLSVTMPKGIQISLSDRRGRRITAPAVSSVEIILSFLRQARFPCILSAPGYSNIVLRRKSLSTERTISSLPPTTTRLRSRHEVRLLNAFNRGCVSPYSIRSNAL